MGILLKCNLHKESITLGFLILAPALLINSQTQI